MDTELDNFGIPSELSFQSEVYCKVDRLLTGITAQHKGTTAQWYSNKTSLIHYECYRVSQNYTVTSSVKLIGKDKDEPI